jgi:glycosyltransferase involved in cell wall biosynthesis
MGWEEVGGIGERKHLNLFSFMKDYRFFFNPIRYTSLGLAVCEAMTIGLPILGLATTEMVTAVRNGVNGFVETDRAKLYRHITRLLADHEEALFLSRGARHIATERFNIERFREDWHKTITDVVGHRSLSTSPSYSSSKVTHASLND